MGVLLPGVNPSSLVISDAPHNGKTKPLSALSGISIKDAGLK